nr:hypothetical protein [Tanacetum cinerariifolium]
MDHKIDFSGSDQIQNPQYPDVHENPLTNDEFEAFMKANDDKINNLEIEFNHFQKQCEQMQDDLLNQIRNFIQNFQNEPPGEDKEHEATTDTELFSTKDIQPLPVQEPPQNSDMYQIIEECCVEASEEQKQNMEKTMFDLVKICHHKQFLCIYDDVDDLMESTLDSKLLSINSINSQRLYKKEQEVKIVEEQPAKRRNHAENITPETESDEVTESNAKNLLPILSECEVALEDKRECDLLISENSPVCDNSDTFSDSKINDDISVYNDDFKDIEYVEASLPDPKIVSIEEENDVEEENVVHREEEEDNPSISRPPPEPPGDNFDLEPEVISAVMEDIDKLNEDKHFNPGREINVSTKIEDDDYFPFMFVIRFFLLYFIFPDVSPLLLSAKSEDTIFDPGISD